MKKGFTLIEIMTVMVFVGLMAAIVIPACIQIKKDSEKSKMSPEQKHKMECDNIKFTKVGEVDGYNVYRIIDNREGRWHYVVVPKPVEK